jgi:hypothetical protein
MKLLVATTGAFQLRLEDTRDLVKAFGVSVVQSGSGFLNQNVGSGRIEILGKVGDEATQADWDDALKQSDGNQELALAAFQDEFPVPAGAKPDLVLPVTDTSPSKANPSGQTAGLADDVKPAAPGQTEGPGGPKDTNKGDAKPHSTHKGR